VALTSAVLYGGGIALAGVAGERLGLLYLGYGVLGGAGLGLGYIVPVAMLVGWFPHRRGLMTGVAVSSFAVGALVATPLDGLLVDAVGPLDALVVLGVVVLVLIGTAAAFLRPPPGTHPAPERGALRAALREPRWYALWAVFFLSVTAGVGFVGEAAPLAEELTGVGAVAAAGLVGGLFVADAAGRLLCPWASDALGRRAVLVAIFLGQAGCFLLLTQVGSAFAFAVAGALVLFLYGGSSGTMPAAVADAYGADRVGSVYGPMLTAWGLGGVLGPMLLAALREATGAYTTGLLAVAATMAGGALLAGLVVKPPRRAAGSAYPSVGRPSASRSPPLTRSPRRSR
jgi:OFA family oxalate/formate antiporter-like MFS transporter